MNRRGFLASLAAVPVAATFAPKLAEASTAAPEFPEYNWIDLPDDITSLVTAPDGVLYAFTFHALYRIDGCYPPFGIKGRRFFAMDMAHTDMRVTRSDRHYIKDATVLQMK